MAVNSNEYSKARKPRKPERKALKQWRRGRALGVRQTLAQPGADAGTLLTDF